MRPHCEHVLVRGRGPDHHMPGILETSTSSQMNNCIITAKIHNVIILTVLTCSPSHWPPHSWSERVRQSDIALLASSVRDV